MSGGLQVQVLPRARCQQCNKSFLGDVPQTGCLSAPALPEKIGLSSIMNPFRVNRGSYLYPIDRLRSRTGSDVGGGRPLLVLNPHNGKVSRSGLPLTPVNRPPPHQKRCTKQSSALDPSHGLQTVTEFPGAGLDRSGLRQFETSMSLKTDDRMLHLKPTPCMEDVPGSIVFLLHFHPKL